MFDIATSKQATISTFSRDSQLGRMLSSSVAQCALYCAIDYVEDAAAARRKVYFLDIELEDGRLAQDVEFVEDDRDVLGLNAVDTFGSALVL